MALVLVALPGSALPAASVPPARTLILVLDGVPFRVVERAVAEGAFAGWPPPARMVGPFPSMTNPSLTLMLSPLGVPPAPGYEVQHFDWQANEVHGGGAFEYADGPFPWRAHVRYPEETLLAKFAGYVRPAHRFEQHLRWAEQVVLEYERDLVVLHVGSLDALQHVKGDDAMSRLMPSLDAWARALAARHVTERGGPLRIVMLSDHGNGTQEVRRLFGGRDLLRRAGLRVKKRLESPGDVVVGTFGVTGYAALYTDDASAETAARSMLAHPGVDLASWRSGAHELRVVARAGDALIRWTDEAGTRRFGYEPVSGDPLALAETLVGLREAGQLGDDGLAAEDAWLAATADAAYPDALERLVTGLTGAHVINRATVLVSLQPGWAWGWKSAATFAWFRGGALEATHGGLDRESSLGFLLVSDPALLPGPVVRSSDALTLSLAAAPTAPSAMRPSP